MNVASRCLNFVHAVGGVVSLVRNRAEAEGETSSDGKRRKSMVIKRRCIKEMSAWTREFDSPAAKVIFLTSNDKVLYRCTLRQVSALPFRKSRRDRPP